VRPVRLAHIDGSTGGGAFNCSDQGVLTPAANGSETIARNNLAWRFSSNVCASVRAPADKAKSVSMLQSGFTLVKSRCDDFFAEKASNQGRVRLARSVLEPLSTAITSVFAVVDLGSESDESDALALLAAGTTLARAGIDIYEEQFLFDADNIAAVRGLTIRALDSSQQEILARDLATFDVAVRQLTDHQNICTPANILLLVRAAIDTGEIAPRERGGTDQQQREGGASGADDEETNAEAVSVRPI
jgi:hypothetical protein